MKGLKSIIARYNIYRCYAEAVMHFNIYLDDETGEQLNHAARQAGESRNAVIRRAVGEWLERHGMSQWPDDVLHFNRMTDLSPLEASRDKLESPAADPLA